MSLSTLPNELLKAIWQSLDSQCDMNALIRTSSRCYYNLNTYLYRHAVQHHCRATISWAAKNGQEGTLLKLMDQGVDLIRDPELSPIFDAARHGKDEVIRFLIERGADLDMKDEGGWTALSLSATWGYAGVVRLLLENGANVNEKDDDVDGWTPLIAAAQHPEEETLSLLLQSGADAAVIDAMDRSALWCIVGQGSVRGIRMLLEKTPRDIMNLPDRVYHLTPLAKAVEDGELEAAQLLVEAGADMDIGADLDHNALALAITNHRTDVLRMLLDKGASPNRTEKQSAPLLLAAEEGTLEIVQLLLERGADPDHVHPELRSTALGRAAWCGNEEVVRLLLDVGADPNSPTSGQYNPLISAVLRWRNDVATTLLEHGVDPDPIYLPKRITPLLWSIRGGNKELVDILLQKDVNIEARTGDGHTALLLAALNGWAELIKPLLKKGADPCARDWYGRTPLAIAAHRGFGDVVVALLEDGPDPESWNCRYHPIPESAELKACPSGRHIRSGRGRALDTPDVFNRTPLFYATVNGYDYIVHVLLARGSRAVDIPTCAGRTPRSVAQSCVRRVAHTHDVPIHDIWEVLRKPATAEVLMEPLTRISEGSKRLRAPVDHNFMTLDPWDMWTSDQYWCDTCLATISEYDQRFHCNICDDDNYDLCMECMASGKTCRDDAHTLEKYTISHNGDWRMAAGAETPVDPDPFDLSLVHSSLTI